MKVFLQSIGCRLNQAELSKAAECFAQKGYEITENPDEADIAVINTCSVTAAAASDSRGKIRLAGRSGKTKVFVTGCWSDLEPEKALRFPGVFRVIRNADKDEWIDSFIADGVPVTASPVLAPLGRTRICVKVQDGCDNFCTFCVTRLARGKSRSIPVKKILAEIHEQEQKGIKEVVLSGVNLGAWGLDFEVPTSLTHLLEIILAETEIPRIRLSSLESWNVDDRFLRLWEDQRLCSHLHLPLQSGSPTVLKRMARRTKISDFRQLMSAALVVNPDFAITTDVIVGFPGETEREFNETVELIQELRFAGGHVFSFSAREGTAAARMADHVVKSLARERSKILRDLFAAQKSAFYAQFVGRKMAVLWEHAEKQRNGFFLKGLTGNYLSIVGKSEVNLQNTIHDVKCISYDGSVLESVFLLPLR